MTKSIIAIFAVTSILLSGSIMTQEVYGPDEQPENLTLGGTVSEKSIPDWVDQNFRWYAQEQISQTEIINSLEFLVTEQIILLPSTVQTAESQEITHLVSELQKKIDELETQIVEVKTQTTLLEITNEEQQMKFPEDEVDAELGLKSIPPDYSLTTYVNTIQGDATNGFSDPLIAKCDKGDVATGGGIQTPHYKEFSTYHLDFPVGRPNPTGWQFFSPTIVPDGVKVWVVCLDITPEEFAK